MAQGQAEEAARAEAARLAAEAAKREEAATAAFKEAAKAKKAQREQMLQNQIADVKKHPSFAVFWKGTLESLSDEEQYEFGEHDPEADLAAWEDFLTFQDAKSKKLEEENRARKATADDLAKQTARSELFETNRRVRPKPPGDSTAAHAAHHQALATLAAAAAALMAATSQLTASSRSRSHRCS